MSAEQPPIANRAVTCARCGANFECGLSGECWCAAEPYRMPMTSAAAEDCLCPACLRKAAQELAAAALAAKPPPR